jgi:hypothetical protein
MSRTDRLPNGLVLIDTAPLARGGFLSVMGVIWASCVIGHPRGVSSCPVFRASDGGKPFLGVAIEHKTDAGDQIFSTQSGNGLKINQIRLFFAFT